MACSNSRYGVRFVVDLTLLLLVLVAIFLVKKLWPPFYRGMICNDHSLTYPFIDSETITDSILLLYGVAVPVNVMCLIEFLRARRETIGKEMRYFGRKFSSWLWAMYSTVGVFLFGCAVTQLATDIAKVSLGELRPHFIDVCKPDWNKTNCSKDSMAFVFPVPCTTADSDLDRLKDARQSFPSGHASFSTYTMLYLVFYLQARLKLSDFKLVKPMIQLVCLLLNFFTCLSRISDYKHHWYDVVGGFLLGLAVAILVAVYVSDLFVKRTPNASKNTVVMLQDYHQTTSDEPHTNSHP